MKCIVSDYLNGKIKIINIDNSQTEEIEEILTERVEYSLENIEWKLVDDDKIRYDSRKDYEMDGHDIGKRYMEILLD
jgi:hypothetical protein